MTMPAPPPYGYIIHLIMLIRSIIADIDVAFRVNISLFDRPAR